MSKQWPVLITLLLMFAMILIVADALGPKFANFDDPDEQQLELCDESTDTIRLLPFINSDLINVSYRHYCSIPFIYLLKKRSNVLLLMMQVNLKTGSFVNLNKIIDVKITGGILVVARVSVEHSGNYFLYNRNSIEAAVYLSRNTYKDILLFGEYRIDSAPVIHFSPDDVSIHSSVVNSNDSFTVNCISFPSQFPCTPEARENTFDCACPDQYIQAEPYSSPPPPSALGPANTRALGVILPSLVSLIILTVMAAITYHEVYHNAPEIKEPEEQLNLILCNAEDAVYEYNLIFRVGCSLGDFDMERNYIDFEVVGPGCEMIGTPQRFACNELPDHIFGEMHCLIGRISPMPTLVGVRANTNDANNLGIFFYEFVLIDLKDDSVLDKRNVCEYIDNQQRLFYGKPSYVLEGENEVGVYPELPLQELNLFELAIIAGFILFFISMMVILFESYNLYLTCTREDGSLIRSLQDIIFIVPLSLLLQASTVTLYKHFIKKTQFQYDYTEYYSPTSVFCYICKLVLGFLLGISLILVPIIISHACRISFIMSWYWWASFLNISVITLGSWAVANKLSLLKNFIEGYGDQSSSALASPSITYTMYGKMYVKNSLEKLETESKTMYFTQKNPTKIIDVGPKMTNPNLGRSRKRKKLVNVAKNVKENRKRRARAERHRSSRSLKK